ncbi:MAG: hypothetical protein COC06_05760 [Bacteroidales bacterium]|nr:MAG: hypothetical protein COC06_05760 [Bacteroidales bacterium]
MRIRNILYVFALVFMFVNCKYKVGCEYSTKKEVNKKEVLKKCKLIAHRGGIVEAKFNEYDPRSIQAAIDQNYYMLEIDIRESKDGVLVVNHDGDFTRFFNNVSMVKDLTWDEIKQLKSDKGNYHPISFESLAKMCEGKIKLMIDLKLKNPTSDYYKKIGDILEKYNLFEGAFFINKEARKYYWGKAKFEFRVNERIEIERKLDAGEDIASNYFLFDRGNRLTTEAVMFCQINNIEIIPMINIGHYIYEDHMKGAHRDIEYWKSCGVTEFLIDSDYDRWLSSGEFNSRKKKDEKN